MRFHIVLAFELLLSSCDALYEAGLQSVADKHFNQDQYTDKILNPFMTVSSSAGVLQPVTSLISKDTGLKRGMVEFQSAGAAQIAPVDSISYTTSSLRKDLDPGVLPALSSKCEATPEVHPSLTSRSAWHGRPLETVGCTFGSEREIEYSVFGKRVEQYSWAIEAHITNGSADVYEALTSKRKNDGYIELKHPKCDYIKSDGRIWLDVECKQPWRLCQGKQNVSLNTKTIWRNDTHSSCYHDFEVEDCERSAPTLRCTIKTYFEDKDRNISRSVQLVISQTSR